MEDVTVTTLVTYFVENGWKYQQVTYPGGAIATTLIGDENAPDEPVTLPDYVAPEDNVSDMERIAALEEENASMVLELAQNQIRFDEMEQANADLLFALVDKGVL